MNNHLSRIKVLDEKIQTMRKILKSGEYMAAGIKFELTVGVKDDSDFEVELGIASDLEVILKGILAGMLETRAWRVREARDEFEQLQSFFELSEQKVSP